MYVSITGFCLKAWWHLPRFMLATSRAARQARRAAGNISTELNVVDGVYHTVTVWQDRAAMRAYVCSGAHAAAMRIFPAIGAGGRIAGYSTDTQPSWAEALDYWRAHGRAV